jgi:hypothetical protein
MVGYPFTVHAVLPVLVTVIRPVIVPAAPWPWAGVAVMWLHAVEVAAVEVVAGAPVVVVEVGADVVDVAACVVVVTFLGLLGLLLHAASTTAAQATKASAQRGAVTPRNPRAAPSRGIA